MQLRGVVDEMEYISSIIEEMKMDDQDLEEATVDEDSSDEEKSAYVPAEWRNQIFSQLVVSEGHRTL